MISVKGFNLLICYLLFIGAILKKHSSSKNCISLNLNLSFFSLESNLAFKKVYLIVVNFAHFNINFSIKRLITVK
jgi:hypothetical protein